MDIEQTKTFVNQVWDDSITPTLVDYIKIPNKSPLFDPDWAQHGFMEQAVELIVNWCREHAPNNMTMDILREPGRTPLIFMDIPGDGDKTVLLYGHLDKQPEMSGWEEDLGPWKPVIRDDKLYGRGGADDGYSAFSALTAINALQAQGISHPRCVVVIEASEESGSMDLPFYMQALHDCIGRVDCVICLDSGAGNYEQLWSTTSLRGVFTGVLSIELMKEGIHSGMGTGVVASTFRVLRQLLDRVENSKTGDMTIPALVTDIPEQSIKQAQMAADVLANDVIDAMPLLPGVKTIDSDPATLLLNRTWRASLEVVGMEHMPSIADGGNVLRPALSANLSFRVPPTGDADAAAKAVKDLLEADAPYGAKISFTLEKGGNGWSAPPLADWLADANEQASQAFFEKPAMYMGEGGSIPFMGMLGEQYPDAQFLITGVLGPQSNAHGPNEFLHLTYAKKVTCCVAKVLALVK